MKRQLRFTGAGGQGVLLAGEILAEAKNENDGYAVKAATYTSQVRGGPTKVDIVFDEEEILFPYADEGEIEYMLSTAQKSYDLYKSGVKEGSIIVIEPALVKPSEEDLKKWRILPIPIIETAKTEVGNVLTQSVVALGVTVAITGIVPEDVAEKAMLSKVPAKMKYLNKKAFDIGMEKALQAVPELKK